MRVSEALRRLSGQIQHTTGGSDQACAIWGDVTAVDLKVLLFACGPEGLAHERIAQRHATGMARFATR